MNFANRILFTGAGFTADFGGFLMTEMWSKIFNNKNLEKYPKIKKLLRGKFNFEFVYWLVNKGKIYSNEERLALKEAIVEAYRNMDANIANHPITTRLGNLVNLLRGDSTDIMTHFTLNQDLFMERRSRRQPLGLANLTYKDYLDRIQSGRIDSSLSVQLPDDKLLEDFKENHLSSAGDLFYIKLHGSCDWLSADGSNAVVIGYEKAKDIEAEPLLKWYFDLFKQTLNVGNAKILIIGYSFGDKHVNIELAKAVKNSGLKIYVVSPESPNKLKAKVSGYYKSDNSDDSEKATDCSLIWEAVEGYFPYRLKKIFPSSGSVPPSQLDLIKAFS